MTEKQKSQCVMCRTKYPSSDKETVEQLRPWVEKGKAWAQFVLGQQYERGLGVEQSYQQARELYELAASQGNATAQYNLGDMYPEKVKVWIKVTREQKNITRQQQGREMLVRRPIWVFSMETVMVLSNPMKPLANGG